MQPMIRLALTVLAACSLSLSAAGEPAPVDGNYPPPKAPDGTWENLLDGTLADHWTDMSMAITSPLITTRPDPDHVGSFILHIDRGPTGLIRSIKPFENFILEMEWRHLTEAPNAGGGAGTSGNSGLLICHSAFPAAGGPYPTEGHEVQVCNLGNGSWYTSHGDIFTLPGTASQGIPDPRFAVSHGCGHRSMPVEFRGSKTGEWNKVRITCVDGILQQEVNGALVTSLYRISPRKGYMSFESEGGPVEFRNMRLQALTADPDLLPKHVPPLLPEGTIAHYLSERQSIALPAGDFQLMVDISGTMPLAGLADGLGLPATAVDKGRVLITVANGKVAVTAGGKSIVADQPVPTDAPRQLHLEAPAGFGHVLLLTQPTRP